MARPTLELVNPQVEVKSVTGGGTVEPSTFYTPGTPYAKHYRTYAGSVTPGYHSLSKRAKTRLRPLSYDLTKTSCSSGGYSETEIWRFISGLNAGKDIVNRKKTWNDGRGVLSIASPTVSTEASNRAISNLARNLQDMKVNLAQAFAERKQTASLINATVGRLVEAALAIKSRDLNRLANALRVSYDEVAKRFRKAPKRGSSTDLLSDLWLEYSFGWRPLIADVYGSCELIAKHVRDGTEIETVKGSNTQRWSTHWLTQNPWTEFEANNNSTTKVVCRFRLDSNSRAMLSNTGLSNPALLAWELLPYSFVVDWFIPVGNYLQALDAFSGFEFVDGYSVGFHQGSSTCRRSGSTKEVWNGSAFVRYESTGFTSYAGTRYTRQVLAAFPSVGLPRFRSPLGEGVLTKALSSIALLNQVFSRGR